MLKHFQTKVIEAPSSARQRTVVVVFYAGHDDAWARRKHFLRGR